MFIKYCRLTFYNLLKAIYPNWDYGFEKTIWQPCIRLEEKRVAWLSDFSWFNIPKRGKYTKLSQNIPNGQKIYQKALILDQMSKYTNKCAFIEKLCSYISWQSRYSVCNKLAYTIFFFFLCMYWKGTAKPSCHVQSSLS
jgi:hypothetical protein